MHLELLKYGILKKEVAIDKLQISQLPKFEVDWSQLLSEL